MTERDKGILQRYADFLGVRLLWDGDWTGSSVYVGTDDGGPAINCRGLNHFPDEANEFGAPEWIYLGSFELIHEIHHFLVANALNPTQLCFPDYGMGGSIFETANHGYHLMEEPYKSFFSRLGFFGVLTADEANFQERLCWLLDSFVGWLLQLDSHSMDCEHETGNCLGWCQSWPHYYDLKERDFLRSIDGPFPQTQLTRCWALADFIICWCLGSFLQKEIPWLDRSLQEWAISFWKDVREVRKNGTH